MYRYLSVMAATAALSMVMAGTPALAQGMADDSACVMAGLLGEEFGLCNAYCEAMDCDSVTPQASAKACEKVRAKFEAIEGVPKLPCLAVAPTNAAPVLDLDAVDDCPIDGLCGATATFVSFGDAVPIAVDVVITDSDGDIIVSATVTLTNPLDGAEETLSLSPEGLDLLVGLVSGGVVGEGTDTLLITGDGTLAQYSEILQEVVYINALGDPDTTARIITVQVEDDGFADFVSNEATSLMVVEVGCPCPAFSSDIIIDTGLLTYVVVRGPRTGCGPTGVDCYNSVDTFITPQVESCTKFFTETVNTFQYDVHINDALTQPENDRRTFEVKAGGRQCEMLMTGSREGVMGRPQSLFSFNEFRADGAAFKPFHLVSPFTAEMDAACIAAVPQLKAKLVDFWESPTGIARLPRCTP